MKTVIHVIDSLGRGGAETLLVETLKGLTSTRNIVVLLNNVNDFGNVENCEKIISIDFKNTLSIPICAYRLNKIIKKYKADIVHSHLFFSTIIARLACPGSVKCVFSVHSVLSLDCFNNSTLSKNLEKITYRKRDHAIFVSNVVKEDYDNVIGIKGKADVLYNFISPKFFNVTSAKRNIGEEEIKLVAVGNLKEAKNYHFLVEAFKLLKQYNLPVSLDIFGEGYLRPVLEKEIFSNNLPITLKGLEHDISKVLQNYDIFVMSSLHEGFGLAPLEAMAMGLPVLLSDIKVFREVMQKHALFFDATNPKDFVEKIKFIINNRSVLIDLSIKGIEHALEVASREKYINKLLALYNE